MKLRSRTNNLLGILAVFAAVLAENTIVAITGNRTVNKAGAGSIPVGRVFKPATAVNGKGSIETGFSYLAEIKFDGAVAAGDRVKMAAADGDGNQRVKKWVAQDFDGEGVATGDTADLICGICWNGGADGTTGEVLFY